MGITLHCGDCLEIMKTIPDKSIDLVLTDPPYGIGKNFENDNLPKQKYIDWCQQWIFEMNRVLKYGGSIWITLGWQCVAEIKCLFNEIQELRLKNWIIWYRQDGWKGNKGFAQSYEHILYFIKDGKEHPETKQFGEYIKQKRKDMGLTTKKSRQLLGLRIYSSCGNAGWLWFETGRIPNLEEYSKLKSLLGLDDRFDNFIKENYIKFNKTDECNDLWLTPKSEKNRLGHPTQKPLGLIERMVTVSSNLYDTILDPFAGSFTTAVACKKLKRNCIAIEVNPKYYEIGKKRVDNTIEPML